MIYSPLARKRNSQPMNVLIVENNPFNMEQLSELLEKEGYKTLQASNGTDALNIYKEQQPDFICLDIMMDDVSGYDVCREIRKTDVHTPIIFISGKSDSIDKVIGLEIGADDYIVKPFDVHEVNARIRAVARRCIVRANPQTKDEEIQMNDVTIFPQQLKGKRSDQTFDLSLREIKILKLFKENQDKLVSRDMLLDHCWGAHIMPESRTIDWHISKLRKKIEADENNPQIIKTVHGAGYRFGH